MALRDHGDRAACENAHSFDFAKSGYLNLTLSGAPSRVGDSKEMVRARAGFFAAGFFDPVAEAVARAAESLGGSPSSVVEVGSGTGYYLDRVCGRLAESLGQTPCGFGVDLSVPASSYAARALPELCFVVADVELRLPLLDRSAGVLLSVFSPRPAAECARICRPGGVLVAAFATEHHLQKLRQRERLLSVHPDKLRQLSARLDPWFEPAGIETVEYEVALGPADVANAIAMGPNARHADEGAVELAPIKDEVSVTVARFERQ